MEARISFIEPLAGSETSEPTTPNELKGTEEKQVQNLIREGIITHKFTATETFDTIFAASELHELPEVSFVAAFKQGVVFLGCPDGPPESIAELVEVIKPARADDTPELSRKLDALLASTEALHLQLDRRNDADTLSQNITSKAAAAQSEDLQSALSEISADLESVKKSVSEIRSVTSDTRDKTQKTLDELCTNSKTLASRLDEGVLQLQNHSAEQSEARASISKSLELVHTTLAETAKDDRFADQLSELLNETAELKAILSGAAPNVTGGIEILNALKENLAALVDKLAANDATSEQRQTSVVQMLDAILDRTRTGDQHEALVKNLPDQISAALEQSHATLLHEIKRLKNEPKPVIDLTEQRRGFAAFTTGMGTITKRLETAVEHMSSQSAKEDGAQSEVLEHIEALPNKLQDLIANTALSAMNEKLALLQKTALDADTQFAALHARFDSLLDAAKAEIAGLKELQLATEDTSADALVLDRLVEKFGFLATQIEAMPDAIGGICAKAIDDAEPPSVQLDLTAQRESFARFGTAMGTVVKRLENAIAQLDKPHTNANAKELHAVMQALPVIIHQASTGAKSGDVTEGALAGLRDDIAHVVAQMPDLDSLRRTIESLARRPDPMPDLSEQRRSFARFTTAMASVVNRLEQVSDAMVNTQIERSDFDLILQNLQDINTQFGTAFATQSKQTEVLESKIVALANDARAYSVPPVNGVNGGSKGYENLEELRYLFAEQIALQLRDDALRKSDNR